MCSRVLRGQKHSYSSENVTNMYMSFQSVERIRAAQLWCNVLSGLRYNLNGLYPGGRVWPVFLFPVWKKPSSFISKYSSYCSDHLNKMFTVLLICGGLVVFYLLLCVTVLHIPKCKSTAKLHGKTVIVTGMYVWYSPQTVTHVLVLLLLTVLKRRLSIWRFS